MAGEMMVDPQTLGIFITIFISFLVIMDPFASAAYYLAISRKFSDKEKKDAVKTATLMAGITLLVFFAIGPFLLQVLGITMSSFQIAGGIVLMLISIKFIMGGNEKDGKGTSKDAAIMIIGVPMITGPGVLTTAILMVGAYGYPIPVAAATCALIVTWIILKLSDRMHSIIGDKGMEILSRMMGLLLAAIAVEMVKKGVFTTLQGMKLI
ncbi:MarC family integral membrane protein [Candidatus Gugararchaeum adminiculabundum]|nr:MarC family integral membrane protein [Candidatus Gugararchaeum adminiculabundum]